MSTLHGTLDKCATCPVRDLCPDDEECIRCEHGNVAEHKQPCLDCIDNNVCNFTPMEGVDELGGGDVG